MKTVRMLGDRKTEVIEVEEPKAVDDKVVVKIMSSMLCGTEKHYYGASKPMPDNAGHEAAGIIHAVDKSNLVKEGDHVSLYLNFPHCFRCPACMSGEWLHCMNPPPKFEGRRGTHSEYLLVPDHLCLPIPQDMSFDHAALVDDCFGTPYRSFRKLGLNGGDTVLITGSGPIGLAAVRLAKFYGATVIATSTNEYRLEQMKKDAADYAFNPKKDDVVAKVMEITDNRGATLAMDTSGADSAQQECLDAVGLFGRVAFVGIGNDSIPVSVGRHFIHKEITITGSWASVPEEHFEILGLLKRGLPADDIVTHTYNIDQGVEAFDKFGDKTAMKIAIHPFD